MERQNGSKAKGNCCILKEKMMEDIRREAGRVASEKHLTMIFTQYRANISAEDVTGDIAGKIIAMGKQEDK